MADTGCILCTNNGKQVTKDVLRVAHFFCHLIPLQPHNGTNRFKTNLCRDFLRGGCPRGNHCTFAHSEEEQDR